MSTPAKPHVKPLNWLQPLEGLQIVKRGDVPITRVQIYGRDAAVPTSSRATIEANMPDGRNDRSFGFKHWFVPRQNVFVKDTLVWSWLATRSTGPAAFTASPGTRIPT